MSSDPGGGRVSDRLGAIDLLRGIAILLVLNHHLYGGFVRARFFVDHPILMAIPANGAYGVNLFFALSGFVLFLPIAQSGRQSLGWFDLCRFYRRRARRLLPLYYLSVAVAFVLAAGRQWPTGEQWRTLAEVVTFGFQFDRARFFPSFNPVLWSLAVEVSFSLVLPFLAALWLRVPTVPLFATIVLGTTATRVIAMQAGPSLPLAAGLLGRLDDFAIGMAAAWLFVHRPPTGRPWLWIAGGLLSFQLGCMTSEYWLVTRNGTLYATAVHWLVALGSFALMRGALVVVRPTSVRLVQLAGRMSYSLYIWHVILRDQMIPTGPFVTPSPVLPYLAVLIAVSAVTYRSSSATWATGKCCSCRGARRLRRRSANREHAEPGCRRFPNKSSAPSSSVAFGAAASSGFSARAATPRRSCRFRASAAASVRPAAVGAWPPGRPNSSTTFCRRSPSASGCARGGRCVGPRDRSPRRRRPRSHHRSPWSRERSRGARGRPDAAPYPSHRAACIRGTRWARRLRGVGRLRKPRDRTMAGRRRDGVAPSRW